MNYHEALPKLERLLELGKTIRDNKAEPGAREEFSSIYGTVEDLVRPLITSDRVQVRGPFNNLIPYPNLIEAGFISTSGEYTYEGYLQLQKVVGKVRQLASDPSIPRVEPAITTVVQTLRRFRECCQYLSEPPTTEVAVQEVVWIMLRAQHDRVDREDVFSRFGVRNYRPDFGLPDLRLLIEIKFIGPKTSPGEIQESILADIPGYLSGNSKYDNVVVLVYDYAHKLRDSRRFIEDLRTVDRIVDVIVVPGLGAA